MNKEQNNIFENIKLFFKKNAKTFLFLIIFLCVCLIYNSNLQIINNLFNKGVILEYSVDKNAKLENLKIDEKLKELKINTYEIALNSNYSSIEKTLKIKIPLKINQKNKNKIDEISNEIFESYTNSKLNNVKTAGKTYSSPYNAFAIFLELLFISILIHYFVLLALIGAKTLNSNIKQGMVNFIQKQKEGFKNLIQKTKENGISYLIKKILFDETQDDKEPDYTKEIISTIVFVLVCVIIIRYFIGELRWIPSGSMRPTILERDRVFVEKLDFPKKEIKRGDILVFYPPEVRLSNSFMAIFSRLTGIFCKDMAFIKRTIGLPNEKFEVKYNEKTEEYTVFINDKPLDEPYINSNKFWTQCNEQMYCGPFIIPENNYFMMGDNRGNSQDSRIWGFLSKERIIGRANFMFFPIKRINLLKDDYFELSKQKINNKIEKDIYIINRY